MFPGEGYFDDYNGERAKSGAWIERMFAVTDKIRVALGKMDGQLYPDAKAKLTEVGERPLSDGEGLRIQMDEGQVLVVVELGRME